MGHLPTANPAATSDHHTMPVPRSRRRIVIEFEPGLEPVAGTISAPPAAATEFCGWFELIAVLDGEFVGGGDDGDADAEDASA